MIYVVLESFVIQSFPGYTLTVQPGVTVYVTPGVNTTIRGHLKINGTADAPVVFTSTDTSKLWNDLYIDTTQGASIEAAYLHLSYSIGGVSVACCNTGGPLTVTDSEFTHNNVALGGYAGSVVMTVERTLFDSNVYAVTQADKNISHAEFRNNQYGLEATERINVYNSVFTNNGVAVYGGRDELKCSTLTNNTVATQAFYEGMTMSYLDMANNTTGVILTSEGTGAALHNNNIYSNGLNVQNKSTSNQDATLNWWNSTNATTIEAAITDGYDNSQLGLVMIDPWQTTAVDSHYLRSGRFSDSAVDG